MNLLVDKSEQSSAPDVVSSLKSRFANVFVTNLPHRPFGNTNITAGDINIPLEDGSILAIERKTPDDFLQSIPERRIFNQVEVMHSIAKFVAIIITGKIAYSPVDDTVIADRRNTEWDGKSVRAALRKIQMSNCIVEFCPAGEYPSLVNEIYDTCTKIGEPTKSIKNRIVTFPPLDERVQFLAQLPSVGLESAISLLNFAGMMEGVKEIEEVDIMGNVIGTNTYGTVAQALHWMSILSQIDKSSRPKNWKGEKILTNRKFLGLNSNEYIDIGISKDE